MHLVSRDRAARAHRGRRPLDGLMRRGVEIVFAEGESIWTESSYKYTSGGNRRSTSNAPVSVCFKQWIDRDDGFALTLAEAA